jgi:hypothetical protein
MLRETMPLLLFLVLLTHYYCMSCLALHLVVLAVAGTALSSLPLVTRLRIVNKHGRGMHPPIELSHCEQVSQLHWI